MSALEKLCEITKHPDHLLTKPQQRKLAEIIEVLREALEYYKQHAWTTIHKQEGVQDYIGQGAWRIADKALARAEEIAGGE